MDVGQQALLSTVDRVLREHGEDPAIIAPEDKVCIATQYVQLAQLHEHTLGQTRRLLAEALGARPGTPLEVLVADATAIIERRAAA